MPNSAVKKASRTLSTYALPPSRVELTIPTRKPKRMMAPTKSIVRLRTNWMRIQATETDPATISPSASVLTWGRTAKYRAIGTAAPKIRLGSSSLTEGAPGFQEGSSDGVSESEPLARGADPGSMPKGYRPEFGDLPRTIWV